MTYVRTRWKYFQECWKHAQHHWVATVIATCAIAYSTWTEYVEPFVDVPEFHFHKLPVSWALVIAFAALFFVVLEGSYRLRSQTVGNDLLPSDPLIYFELIDRRSELARRTPFEAHNRGKTVAHNILIHPIELGRRIATFKEVDSLDTGDKAEIIPVVTIGSELNKPLNGKPTVTTGSPTRTPCPPRRRATTFGFSDEI